jgi:hypothetical protein
MIYCKQINEDRLGNQLFRFANAYAMAKRHNDTLRIDWKLNYKNAMSNYRIYPGIPIDAKVKFNYAQPNLGYNEIPYVNGMNLDGYFQSEKYFEDCADDIRKMFRTDDRPIRKACAVHVRRGDYLDLQGVLPVLPMSYYQHAMFEVRNRWNIDEFIVYSDDPDWCKKEFSNVEHVGVLEDFEAMQNYHCNIIANSTYSWWAAWLAGHDRVIAPKTWFGHITEMFVQKDIVPDRWVTV